MKYVPAEKLIVEIKALKRRKGFLPFENTEITEAYMARGVQFTCDDIVNLIQSLQQEQPEVDLEKELDNWRHEHFKGKRDGDYCGEYLERESQLDLVRHFYQLGLNARKEE